MFKYFLIWLMVLRSYGNTANETKQSFRTIKSPLHDKNSSVPRQERQWQDQSLYVRSFGLANLSASFLSE